LDGPLRDSSVTASLWTRIPCSTTASSTASPRPPCWGASVLLHAVRPGHRPRRATAPAQSGPPEGLGGAHPRAGGSHRALPTNVSEWRWSTGVLVALGAPCALPGAQPLAIGPQVRYVSPEEDTSHDARAAKGDAQLVRASETR
jgi:hypothetical protein